MKANFFLLTIIAATVLLGGCVGTNALGVLDASVPEEKQCDLEIRNSLSVILFNNKPVEWAPGLTKNRVTITLPPGNHAFTAVYYVTEGNATTGMRTRAVSTTIKQEFIPGHSYRIYKQSIWLLFVTISNVKIKDTTPKK
jgi:hypothetical protein